ncbi:hypothetical protein [Gemmata massiliana]|uniref:hypothetical protein n=1 Tax=Gemmata massiliana TaxID=1210884 RepID=UPI001E560619|nr:hypothetical protein [Gemmata massiliana]
MSDRKLRLFAVACCRSVWHLVSEPLVRKAIEIAECYADGQVLDEDIDIVHREVANEEAGWHYGGGGVQLNTAAAAAAATAAERYEIHWGNGSDWYVATTAEASAGAAGSAWLVYAEASIGYYDDDELRSQSQFIEAGKAYAQAHASDSDLSDHNEGFLKICRVEEQRQCECLRCFFGDPFKLTIVDPFWLTSTVLALVESIYADRAFDRMPILADALQDAGCDNADILAHCRDTHATHGRGCWVVDLLTGRK